MSVVSPVASGVACRRIVSVLTAAVAAAAAAAASSAAFGQVRSSEITVQFTADTGRQTALSHTSTGLMH
jgi:hypothetical protein